MKNAWKSGYGNAQSFALRSNGPSRFFFNRRENSASNSTNEREILIRFDARQRRDYRRDVWRRSTPPENRLKRLIRKSPRFMQIHPV